MKKDTITLDNSILPKIKKPGIIDRISQQIVLDVFSRFQKRGLEIVLPNGEFRSFGNFTSGEKSAQLRIHDLAFFRRVVLQGEIGFGEAYMDDFWSTDDLPGLLECLIDNLEAIPGMSGSKSKAFAFNALNFFNNIAHWQRRNTKTNSRRNIQDHYDLSNEFYSLWLDKTWTYSSAWFSQNESSEESLESAQERKYHRLCEKLQLREGMEILEIGCGWGSFSIYAASHFGVSVTAITISEAQFEKATERVSAAGLSSKIKILLCDYRDIEGSFDAIVSIEMLEAVGHEFLNTYFSQCHRLLKPTGRLGLQVIICPDSRYETMRRSSDWIKKYIFPGGQLPSVKALIQSISETGDLYLHHLDSFGLHYARTLRLWRDRFASQKDQVLSLGFDERFLRKWHYYLAYCEAAFNTRNINVSQLVFSRPNNQTYVN